MVVFLAVCINIVIAHVLTTECAYELKLLKFAAVSIDKSGPLVHLISSFLVELILEIVIFLFELLRKLPNDIVFKLEKFSLLLVVVHEDSSFGELSRKVVW